MSEVEQMPLEIWTDINGNATRTQFKGGVKYIRAGECIQLREQNRVLADERDKLNTAIGQAIVTLRYYAKTAISVRAVDTLERIEAALTATSQPYSQATLSCGHHSGKVANHCLMCGEEDTTSQEGQHG